MKERRLKGSGKFIYDCGVILECCLSIHVLCEFGVITAVSLKIHRLGCDGLSLHDSLNEPVSHPIRYESKYFLFG